MEKLGNKAMQKNCRKSRVPVIPASDILPDDPKDLIKIAKLGFPLILKSSWIGIGRGMRLINNIEDVEKNILEGKEAENAFGNSEAFLERYIKNTRHVEVQILGDKEIFIIYGKEIALFKGGNQKVIERAPAPYLKDNQRQVVCEMATKICKHVGYEYCDCRIPYGYR